MLPPRVEKHRELERNLLAVRMLQSARGEESPEEERLLDELEDLWISMTNEERRMLNEMGPLTCP